jgi:hypothetical protein
MDRILIRRQKQNKTKQNKQTKKNNDPFNNRNHHLIINPFGGFFDGRRIQQKNQYIA